LLRNHRGLTLVVVALLVLSCAPLKPAKDNVVNYENEYKEFLNADCCVNMKELVVDRFKEFSIDFKLNNNKKKLNIPGGNSFYKAFELLAGESVSYYKLLSYVLYDEASSKKAAVLPMVAILNADFSVSRLSSVYGLFHRKANLFSGRESYNLHIKIDLNKNPNEKYLLVFAADKFSTQDKQEKDKKTSWDVKLPFDNGIMLYEGHKGYPVQRLPIGHLSIEYLPNSISQPFDRSLTF